MLDTDQVIQTSRSIVDLYNRRIEVLHDLQRINSGQADMTIAGKYQRLYMESTEIAVLDNLARKIALRNLVEIDRQIDEIAQTTAALLSVNAGDGELPGGVQP